MKQPVDLQHASRLINHGPTVIVSAAHPVWVGDQVRGVVIVEETGNAVVAERNRAFERLFNIVLAVLLVGSLALTAYATWLSSRIRRLRESGVVRAEAAQLDASLLGRPLTLLVEVHVHDEHPLRTAGLRQRIADEPAVQQCYAITGEADYLLVITASTMADYEALTGRLFGGDDNVRRFRTSVALGCLKVGLQVPLDRCGPVA